MKSINDGVFFRVFYEGVYEPELSDVLKAFLRPTDRVLDVGGSFGWYATLFGDCTTAGEVRTFEPAPNAFEVLEQNIRLNGQEGVVHAHNLCVGSSPGIVAFVRSEDCALGYVAPDDTDPADVIEIPLVTLDDHSQDLLGDVALVKAHVEGFELEVLTGAQGILTARPQPLVQVKFTDDRLARYGVDRGDICTFLQSRGYDIYELTGSGRVRPTKSPLSHEIFGVGDGKYGDRFRRQVA